MSSSEPMGKLSVLEYALRRRTPVRELQDRSLAKYLPELTGKVIELGALGDGRRALATAASEYLVTNIDADAPMRLDASAMALPDNSVDAFVCESMLEHVERPEQPLTEIRRVLRPGGTLVLLTPWMYPFHAAPNDYLRFSEPALRSLLHGFAPVRVEPLGNFWTSMATFAQLKVRPWRAMNPGHTAVRLLAGSPLLSFGLGCYALSRLLTESDDFAPMYLVIATKAKL